MLCSGKSPGPGVLASANPSLPQDAVARWRDRCVGGYSGDGEKLPLCLHAVAVVEGAESGVCLKRAWRPWYDTVWSDIRIKLRIQDSVRMQFYVLLFLDACFDVQE